MASAFADLIAEARELVNRQQAELCHKMRDYAEVLSGSPWLDNKDVVGPAGEEARQAALYFSMGLSRKLIAAAGSFQNAVGITGVMADTSNMQMLENLLFVAYIRGVARTLELTGQQLPSGDIKPEAEERESRQTGTCEQVQEDCVQQHKPDQHAIDAFGDLRTLGKLLGITDREMDNLTSSNSRIG